MIRMYQCKTSAQAKNYFREALSKADYYIEGQEVSGQFHGKIAKRLGLEGKPIDREMFESFCDNIHPKTGKPLTPRMVKDRRVGYDISVHCPKSVSILIAMTNNEEVQQAVKESGHETMLEIEGDIFTRIRKNGQYDDRHTGEMLWCDFTHSTARAVDENSIPDMHRHTHFFSMNLTYDQVEKRYKAGQFYHIKKNMPYHQARFQKRLADKLGDLGYDIRKTKNGFELAIIPQAAIDHFSKRTNHIGQVAREKGITNPKELDQLGARTRTKKDTSLTMPQLQKLWNEQLIEAGIDETAKTLPKTTDESLTPEQSLSFAIRKSFERISVLRDRQILSQAYEYAVDNKDVSLDEIDETLEKNDTVFKVQVGNQTFCTTELVHKEEKRMVNLARAGIGKIDPIQKKFDIARFKHLNDEQQDVIRHVLTNRDVVTMIKGGAGTGKTTLLKTIVPEIEKTGLSVYLFAPTAEASRDVLKNEGFDKADTVARLLTDKTIHDNIKNQIIWVDEAGMLGIKDTVRILEIANDNNARVIFVGDYKQHASVQRGDAMRILQKIGYIPYVSLNTIYRQKQEDYRQAVKEISEGNINTGFSLLDAQGAIHEVEHQEINQTLVKNYLDARQNRKSALVITPTRANAKTINRDIREGLKTSKKLGSQEKSFTVFESLYLTMVEKQDTRLYKQGQVIQAHQNLKGINKGSIHRIISTINKQIIVEDKSGNHQILPIHKAKDFDVYHPNSIFLSRGDEIRINKNGFDRQGKRLNNGTTLVVKGFTREGNIKTVKKSATKTTSFLLDKKYGNFDYAYCTTSYKAQGKTVDQVIISQPAVTFPASNQKQFYVSISRARENVTIYTDDKDALLSQIDKSGDRQGAMELMKDGDLIPKTKGIPKISDKGYEPEI